MTVQEILEGVKGLTVLELSELVKAFEEEFGVTAAAPVAAVAVAAPAEGGAAGSDQTEFDVILEAAGDEKIKVKAGLMDGALLPVEKLEALAKLPSREVLLAQVVGGMQAPLTGFAGALQGLLRNLVSVLDQVREQKESA